MTPAGTVNMLHDSPVGVPGRLPAPQALLSLQASSTVAAQDRPLGRLVGEVYEDAPVEVRARLLEELLRPMSPYALIGIPGAGAIFAQIRSRNAEWQGFRVETGDIARVQAQEVAALVDWVQRVRASTLRGIVTIVRESPALAGCQAASALLALSDLPMQA